MSRFFGPSPLPEPESLIPDRVRPYRAALLMLTAAVVIWIVAFGFVWPAHAAETLIRSNATGGAGNFDWQAVSASGSGVMGIGGTTWDSSGGSWGITKVKIYLGNSAGTCTIGAFLAQGDSTTPTNKISSTSTVNITQAVGSNPGTFAEYTFEFVPTYSADDTILIGFEGGTCASSNVRAKIAAAQVWGSATPQGFGNNTYSIGKMEIYGDPDALTPPPATENPTTVIVKPLAGPYSETSVPFRFATNVCANDYPGENPLFDWEIEWDDTGWTSFGSGSFDYSGLYGLLVTQAYSGTTCDDGTLTYGIGAIPDSVFLGPFPYGDYRIRARATFDGEDPGDWSSWTEFETQESPVMGGGGGGSWGGDDGSIVIPDVDSPTCKVFSVNGPPDGMSCMWSWIKHSIFIPATAAIGSTFDNLRLRIVTRWPLAYAFDAIEAVVVGLTDETPACPLPSISETETPNGDIPGFNACTIIATATDALDADTGIQTAGATLVYLGGLTVLIVVGARFFNV